jgi:hypothetical protein
MQEAPSQDESDAGEKTARVQSFLGRRWLPRPKALVPKFIARRVKARINQLPPEFRERWAVIWGFSQTIILIVGGFTGLAILISVMSKATIIEPKTAQAVLERVEPIESVSYSVETVRIKTIDGVEVRQDSLIGVASDLKNNKFQVQANGLVDGRLRILGDGEIAVSQRGGNVPGRLAAYPSQQARTPLYAQDILPKAGQLLTNTLTVRGERGWLVTWQPNQEDILRLLQTELLSLEGDDVRALQAGEFEVDYATASVIRASNTIYQIEVSLQVNQARMRILATYRNFDLGGLKEVVLNPEEVAAD